jgi:Beta-lactamase enzyme family
MRQNHAAVIRRRRLAASLSVVAILTVVVVLATTLPSHSSPHHTGGTSQQQPSAPATGSAVPAAQTYADQAATLQHQLGRYLGTRHGANSIAIYDRVSKRLIVVHPWVRGRTASIVKVDILETRLHQTGGDLSEDEQATAAKMIENSDNDSATDLFDDDGGVSGLAGYNAELGLKHTKPNDAWGDTTTSAADQVTLVRALLQHSSLLTDSARRYQRNLMRDVESDQRWGISGGVPKKVIIGNKNGWLPVDEDHDLWAVNSIGWVLGDGKSYVIAVLTQHDTTEEYGIDTIEHVAALAWKHAAVKSPAG